MKNFFDTDKKEGLRNWDLVWIGIIIGVVAVAILLFAHYFWPETI